MFLFKASSKVNDFVVFQQKSGFRQASNSVSSNSSQSSNSSKIAPPSEVYSERSVSPFRDDPDTIYDLGNPMYNRLDIEQNRTFNAMLELEDDINYDECHAENIRLRNDKTEKNAAIARYDEQIRIAKEYDAQLEIRDRAEIYEKYGKDESKFDAATIEMNRMAMECRILGMRWKPPPRPDFRTLEEKINDCNGKLSPVYYKSILVKDPRLDPIDADFDMQMTGGQPGKGGAKPGAKEKSHWIAQDPYTHAPIQRIRHANTMSSRLMNYHIVN